MAKKPTTRESGKEISWQEIYDATGVTFPGDPVRKPRQKLSAEPTPAPAPAPKKSGGAPKPAPRTAPTSVPTFDEMTSTRATPAQEAAMNAPREGVVNPFDSTFLAGVTGALATTEERVGAADAVLQEVTAESQEVRGTLLEGLKQVVEVKGALNDSIADETRQLKEMVAPSQDRRLALAQQLAKLDQMNPVEQGLRSMFDPNYNRRALEAEIAAEESRTAVIARVFDERYAATQRLTAAATTDYELDEAVAQARLANGTEDVRLAMANINIATMGTDSLIKKLEVDGQLGAAKLRAIDTAVADLTIEQINTKVGEATASPEGVAMINEVPVPLGTLQAQQTALVQRGYQTQLLKLSIESRNQELVEFGKKSIVETLTIPDLQKAIADDGMIDGVQYDVVTLGERLVKMQGTREASANETQINQLSTQAAGMIKQIGGSESITALRTQFVGLTGSTPQALNQFSVEYGAYVAAMGRGLEEAKANGTERLYLAQQLPILQEYAKQRQAVIDSAVKTWAGGDKDLYNLGVAWMSGTAPNRDSAIKALVKFARTGPPPGAKFTGEAARLLQIAKEEITRAGSPSATAKAGQGFEAFGKSDPKSKAEREQALLESVAARAEEAYRGDVGEQITLAAWGVAKQKGSPFAKFVSAEDWTTAVRQGDRLGLTAVAKESGAGNGDAFLAMLREGESGELWQKVKGGLPAEQRSLGYWEGRLTAEQMSATFAYLDSTHTGPGFDPAAELNRVFASPEFVQNAQRGTQIQQQSSLGGFIAHAIGGNAGSQDARSQQQMWGRVFAAYRQDRAAMQVKQAQKLMNDPIARTRFILTAMDLTGEQEEHILGLVRQKFGAAAVPAVGNDAALDTGMPVIRSTREGVSREIDAWLMSAQTGNPTTDKMLRSIAPQYKALVGPMTRALNRTGGN